MKILVVFPHLNALAPHSGTQQRCFNIIRQLIRHNHEVIVLTPKRFQGQEEFHHRHLAVYYYRDYGYGEISTWYLTDLNPSYIWALIRIFRDHKDIRFSHIELPWGAIAVRLISRRPVIYDSMEVEYIFARDITVKMPKVPRLLRKIIPLFVKYHEWLTCRLMHYIIIVNDQDRFEFNRLYGVNPNRFFLLQTGPYAEKIIDRFDKVKVEATKKELNLPLDKTLVIFHGQLPHEPNREAFDLVTKYLSKKVSNPDIVFVIAGKNLPPYRHRNVISLGFVQDLKDFLRIGDLAIVPILSGTGMRTKIVDYMIAQLPIITTKKGLEGLALTPGRDVLVSDAVDQDFVEKIEMLTEDIECQKKLSRRVREIYERHFSWNSIGAKLATFVKIVYS